MTPSGILLLLTGIGTVLAAVMVGLGLWLRRLARQRTAAITHDYPDATRVEGGNFLGRLSDGMAQMRGNGTLLLTPDALVFALWLPQKRYVIALDGITALSTPRVFLGKAKGRRLLRVDYIDRDGHADAIAWWVRDRDAWQQAIEKACARHLGTG